MAFFTTEPIFGEDGWDEKYVSKFNAKKKIQFAISANTPEEMRPVIRDGLLYWNRVLGEGKIEVIQLEDQSVKAPHFDMNIVQWVDWETLGTAYASWHSDPRTGEVLSGNIFLPSGKYAVPLMMAKGELYLQVGLKGFAKTELCREGIRHEPESTGPVLTDEVGSHMAKNSLFVTVAHEAGHLLGLRHNFAGSLSSSYDYKDRQSILDKYYRTLTVPDDLSVASTVMDYLPTEEKSLLGDVMRKNPGQALAYDKIAMEVLYHDVPLTDDSRTAFCTDDDVGEYADCQRFDSGRSVVSYAAGSFQAEVKALPLKLMKRYIPSLKSKSANLDRANFNVSGHAGTMVEYISELVSLFKSPRLIAIESKHLSVTNSNRDAIKIETQKYIASEFARLGGASTLIDAVPENFKQNVTAGFQALTEQNPKFKENFASPEQRQQIESQLQITLSQYEEALAQGEINALASADSKQPWADSELSRELLSIISARFTKYALAKTGTTSPAEVIYTDGTKKEVLLPNYVFSDSVRTAAAGIFSGEAEAIEWAVSEKAAAKKALESELEIFGDLGKIDSTKLSPQPLRWMLTNQNLLKKIN